MARRPRACAAPGMGWQAYLAAVKEWRDAEGRKTMDELVGPVMVNDTRQLTPAAIVRLTKLFELLLAGGCSNGIVLGSALEQALKSHIADDSGATDTKIGLDMHVHQLSNHIKTGRYMLRLLRMEEH
eukprot:1562356-Heterocapsa_arctica.AAC.1